jgi:hypothetical protein
MKTNKTVPGQMVINVFKTNLVLKLIRFNAPMLRLDASVNSLLCSNMDLQIRYRRMNMGNDSTRSIGTTALCSSRELAGLVTQMKLKLPGIGWIKQTNISTMIRLTRCHVIAMRQSSIQLSIMNNWKLKNDLDFERKGVESNRARFNLLALQEHGRVGLKRQGQVLLM